MKIKGIYIYLFILIYYCVANLIVVNKLNFEYFNIFFLSIFFLTIPGILLLWLFKVRGLKIGEVLIFSVGLSIVFNLLTGLITNWLFPLVNINNPLTLIYLLIIFDVLFITLFLLSLFRNKLAVINLPITKTSNVNIIFFTIPVLFPILTSFGAISLNNQDTNYISLASYGVIFLYLVFHSILFNKISPKVHPWNIYLIALAFVLSGSLRSLFIAATDATLEYGLANYVIRNNVWNYWQGDNNYYGMLSIVILPPVLSIFLNQSLLIIFKVLYPFIFSLLPVSIYYIFNKIANNKIAFLGTLFFIVQPNFAIWNLLPPRQELAFLFLSLMYLTLFSKSLSSNTRNLLFIVFGFGLMTSHYSTTYLATIVFIFTYIINRLLVVFSKKFRKVRNAELYYKHEPHISLLSLVMYLSLFVLWYFIATNIGFKAFDIAKTKLLNNAFSIESSPINIFNFRSANRHRNYLNDYIQLIENKKITDFSSSDTSKYPVYLRPTSEVPIVNNYAYYLINSEKIKIFLLALGGLSILIGIILSYKILLHNHRLYLILSLVSLSCLLFFAQLPFVNGSYDPIRLYLQMLLILAPFSVFAFSWLSKIHKNLDTIYFTLFTIFYFYFLTHFQYSIIGGNKAQLIFSNAGKDFDFNYTTSQEINAIDWLMKLNNNYEMMVFDNYAQFKIYQSNYYSLNGNVKLDVIPQSINTKDYVFATRANIVQGITFKYSDGGLLIYNFPIEFLSAKKNQVYSNGKSSIFK